jgi:hypothetical protein
MELDILKYCIIEPGKIRLNGNDFIEVEAQESLEKSLILTYRNLGLNYLKFFKMDNLSKLAILGAETILRETEHYENTDKNNFAIVLTNASSSLVTDVNYQKTISNPENYFPSPSLFVYTLPNIAIGEICIKHKIYGENVFLINEEFDAGTIYLCVNELFEHTETEYCITGWVECNDNNYEAFILLVGKGSNNNKFDVRTMNKLYNIK